MCIHLADRKCLHSFAYVVDSDTPVISLTILISLLSVAILRWFFLPTFLHGNMEFDRN